MYTVWHPQTIPLASSLVFLKYIPARSDLRFAKYPLLYPNLFDTPFIFAYARIHTFVISFFDIICVQIYVKWRRRRGFVIFLSSFQYSHAFALYKMKSIISIKPGTPTQHTSKRALRLFTSMDFTTLADFTLLFLFENKSRSIFSAICCFFIRFNERA